MAWRRGVCETRAVPEAVSVVLVAIGGWVLLVVLVLVLGRLAARTRERRRGEVVAAGTTERRSGRDRRSGADRRSGRGDRRAGLPDPRPRPIERRDSGGDRRRGGDRRSGRDRRDRGLPAAAY
jgi:hypothetical protein